MFETTTSISVDHHPSQAEDSTQKEPLLAPTEATSPAESPVSPLEQIKDARDLPTAKQFVKEYLNSGGNLDTLSQSFSPTSQEATPQKPFNPEVNEAIKFEQDRKQFLQKNRPIFTSKADTDEDKATLNRAIKEYITLYEPVDELISELSQELSPLQTEALKESNVQVETDTKKDRIQSWTVLKNDLTTKELQDLRAAVAAHPSLLESLQVPEDIRQQLMVQESQQGIPLAVDLASTDVPQAESDTASLNREKLEEPSVGLTGTEIFLVGLATLMSPRLLDDTLNRFMKEKVTIPALQGLGASGEFIESFRKKNFNASRELLKLSSYRLQQQLESYDRAETRNFLEKLDKDTRNTLVTGEHPLHQFSKDVRNQLFYTDGKLTQSDCEYLGIPTEAK